ncbi:transposase [Streptomyces sp. NPDC086010]|uniref:transposase n=1 Tax=Streptomyces sp. NPDC086010 TaxID=3365745 RepID=UPI0037D3BADF
MPRSGSSSPTPLHTTGADRPSALPPRAHLVQDTERRSGSGVPEDLEFAAKPRLAWQMIEAALDARCTASWVNGDEVYGQDPQLRSALKARGVGYVRAVACTTRVRINQDRTVVQADTATAALPRAPGSDGAPAPGRRPGQVECSSSTGATQRSARRRACHNPLTLESARVSAAADGRWSLRPTPEPSSHPCPLRRLRDADRLHAMAVSRGRRIALG